MNLVKLKKLNISNNPGCYQFLGKNSKIIYIGKAACLKKRIFSYWRQSAGHTPAKRSMFSQIKKIKWIETDSEIEALLLEANLIKKEQPQYNIVLRDDKRFSYIKISTEDEIPGIFVTREIEKQGKYFGPFTSATAVYETLKAIRKIWPYCTERKLKNKACFYSQIKRCTGVCAGNFSLRDYKEKIIKPIILFLSGEKKKVIKKLEVRSKKLRLEIKKSKNKDEKEMLSEELRFLKFQLLNMKNVLAHTRILSVAEKYRADVVELAKVLSLPKIPERIEGYDISNIFGQSAVGSMVVFANGEPNKAEYRKFKIKIEKEGDVWMMKEILERRFLHATRNPQPADTAGRHATNNEQKIWPVPDLMILDGAKAQLNVALRILKSYGLDIPVLAISKGNGLRSAQAPDKIFFPGEKKPLELSLSSPALHIIKRVRDEAHRFAIKYHRELRKKNWLK